MKFKWLYSIIAAIALAISAPVAMACASCHVETGVTDYQVTVVDVGNPQPAVFSKADQPCVSCSANFAPIVTYTEPRKRITYQSPNDIKIIYNRSSAHAQAKPYAHVAAG